MGGSLFFKTLDTKKENHELQQKYTKLQTDLENENKAINTSLHKLNENVSIIDASIKPDEKRWVRIKQVRKAIQDTIKYTNNSLTIKELTDISTAAVDSSEENDVPVSLMLAVITVESNFHIKAISHAGARGLMQIIPDTAETISLETGKRNYDLFKIKDNIQFGSYYLWKMIKLFGEQDLAIRAYNCGPTFTKKVRSGEYPEYPKETINYLIKVNEWKLKYDNLGVR